MASPASLVVQERAQLAAPARVRRASDSRAARNGASTRPAARPRCRTPRDRPLERGRRGYARRQIRGLVFVPQIVRLGPAADLRSASRLRQLSTCQPTFERRSMLQWASKRHYHRVRCASLICSAPLRDLPSLKGERN
jgi:hypothetical protein